MAFELLIGLDAAIRTGYRAAMNDDLVLEIGDFVVSFFFCNGVCLLTFFIQLTHNFLSYLLCVPFLQEDQGAHQNLDHPEIGWHKAISAIIQYRRCRFFLFH